ncbi:MAG: HD domain-containing protein [Desulfomonilaceae bacterium]
MSDKIAIPNHEECIRLLEKYSTPLHIILHSEMVWEVGKVVAEGLSRHKHPLDINLVRASCLLHDIGKYLCILEGRGYHDIRGQEILDSEGLPDIGRIVVQHVVLRGEKDRPLAEEHVLFYADKRVVHDEIVTLDDRFVYLEKTYGKTPEAIKRLNVMKEETLFLERRIFDVLDFMPMDVARLVLKPLRRALSGAP